MSPWISRAAWAHIQGEVAHLRAENAKLTDHRARVERVEAGLSETPAGPKKLLPPMPDAVRAWINSHHGKVIRERLKKEAFQAAKEHGSWERVEAEIARQTPDEEEG